MDFFKKNIKFIIIYIAIIILLLIEFPYYIEAPGGIIDINERINIEDSYKSSGSFNLSYVSEYNATLITLIMSLFNKDYKILSKDDVVPNDINIDDYNYRNQILLKESYSNAIYLAYTKALKDINILYEKIYVSNVLDEAITDINIGDQILEVNGIKVNSKEDVDNIIGSFNVGDSVDIKIVRNNKESIKKAKLIEFDNKPIIGIVVSKIKEMDTIPKIEIDYKARESGPSGGLMLALSIYNSLVKEDITKGRVIVGTGCIDEDGSVGSIGGVEYKLKGAVKSGADIFLVPNGENYDEAIKLKKENNYKIKIKGISTFDEALEYLSK